MIALAGLVLAAAVVIALLPIEDNEGDDDDSAEVEAVEAAEDEGPSWFRDPGPWLCLDAEEGSRIYVQRTNPGPSINQMLKLDTRLDDSWCGSVWQLTNNGKFVPSLHISMADKFTQLKLVWHRVPPSGDFRLLSSKWIDCPEGRCDVYVAPVLVFPEGANVVPTIGDTSIRYVNELK